MGTIVYTTVCKSIPLTSINFMWNSGQSSNFHTPNACGITHQGPTMHISCTQYSYGGIKWAEHISVTYSSNIFSISSVMSVYLSFRLFLEKQRAARWVSFWGWFCTFSFHNKGCMKLFSILRYFSGRFKTPDGKAESWFPSVFKHSSFLQF